MQPQIWTPDNRIPAVPPGGIWSPDRKLVLPGMRGYDELKASGLINTGMVNGGHALVNAGVIRAATGGPTGSPVLWFKADAIAGLSDGDPISTWVDSSGNGLDATQSGTARPTYKTNIQNGLPVVRFDGSNDGMTVSDNAVYKTSVIHMFLVAKTTAASSVLLGYPHDVTHTSPFFRWVLYQGVSGAASLRIDTDDVTTNSGFLTGTYFQTFSYDTTSRDFYFDQTLGFDGTGRTVTYPNAVGFHIGMRAGGGGEYFSGDMCEIIIYGEQLSSGDRDSTTTYLVNKWATGP